MTTETTPAHTPTPWATSPYNTMGIFDSNKRCIAVLFSGISSYDIELEEREANAAYIVTCVNSHAQLLAERDALLATTAKLRERNETLTKALEYYAVTPSSYGQVARAALPTPSVTP